MLEESVNSILHISVGINSNRIGEGLMQFVVTTDEQVWFQ
jgi:hypothetical protein